MRFDPRAQRPEGPVGLGPRGRAIRPRKRADPPNEPHRPNRLFSRLFDHASHRPVDVEPRCAHRTTPVECGRVRAKGAKADRPLNRLLNRRNRLFNRLLERRGPKRRALPLEGPLWPLFERTLARVGPIENRTLARIKFPLARTPRYWFARAPRAGYWLMRAVRQVALHARRVTAGRGSIRGLMGDLIPDKLWPALINRQFNTGFNTRYTLARINRYAF